MAMDSTDALDVLACEYEKRPKGAPSFADLQNAVRVVNRQQDVLVITFDPSAGDALEALAAAERLCCPTIGFDVTPAPPTLRIQATAAQLDIFEQFLTA